MLGRQRRDQALMTGWFAAAYVWRKELPDLGSELTKLRRRSPAKQTNAELLFVMEGLSARLGIPIQHRPRQAKES